ncbi:DUF1508 domain-containing protein [Dactylosporangium siamense]|uniref:DUF1508 domain-containing protein n=1 Tax=Dactylosporangium siamense TaxID=685454 RepID=UPI00194424AE|nr:DUF1508 domain-containing protein [Dactylosporangium siamense]
MIWRLVGLNNRILGVSPGSFAGVQAAAEAVQNVRDRASAGSVAVARDATRRWRWSIVDAEFGVLAVASHGYELRITCEAAVQRFMESATSAVIDETLGRRGRFWRPTAE